MRCTQNGPSIETGKQGERARARLPCFVRVRNHDAHPRRHFDLRTRPIEPGIATFPHVLKRTDMPKAIRDPLRDATVNFEALS
jgi:hypothetical protein